MNLSTQRIWCYACKCEVFIDGKPRRTTTAAPRPTTVVYNDSDNETVDSDNRLHAFDRESYDSGRGSYTTLRTDNSDRRNSNIIYAFDRSVGLNVGMSGDSGESSDTDDGEISSRPRGKVRSMQCFLNYNKSGCLLFFIEALNNYVNKKHVVCSMKLWSNKKEKQKI